MSLEHKTKIINVAVLGFGTMGKGIVRVAARAGCSVRFFDTDKQVMNHWYGKLSLNEAREHLNKHSAHEDSQVNLSARITPASSMEEAISGADLIIEAVSEDPKLKSDLYGKLSDIVDPHTIIASNTSFFSIQRLSTIVKRPLHMVGIHFFNPVEKMKLVEVITLPETEESVSRLVKAFIKDQLGKEFITCKDTPGFVVNRLLLPYLLDATKLAENSVASIQDIDKAMKLGAGHPLGPFSLMDLIGIDVINMIIHNWNELYPHDPLLKPSRLLDEMVANGRLGMKSGQGFFSYDQSKIKPE